MNEFAAQLEVSLELAELRKLLREARNILASYGSAHAGGMLLTEWHKKRIELLGRIGEALK